MKPSEFFVGVTDFFSILLPGAAMTFIASFVAQRFMPPDDHLLAGLLHLDNAAGWAAFLVVAYVFGHVIASLGALLDPLYDQRKARHRNTNLLLRADAHRDITITKLAATAATKPSSGDAEPTTVFAYVINAVLLRNAWSKHDATSDKPINAYKLARITLAVRAPTLYAEVLRLEADSKFFRSLVVVATFGFGACLVQLVIDSVLTAAHQCSWTRPGWGVVYALVVLAILRLSFSRFCELRLKATEAAFQGMLVLDTLPTPAEASKASAAD